jgi:hypothetical protein
VGCGVMPVGVRAIGCREDWAGCVLALHCHRWTGCPRAHCYDFLLAGVVWGCMEVGRLEGTVLLRLILTPEGGSDAVCCEAKVNALRGVQRPGSQDIRGHTLIAVEDEGFDASHCVYLAECDDRFLIKH